MDSVYKPPALSELHFSDTTEKALRADVVLGRKLAMLARDLHQTRMDSRKVQAGLLEYYIDKTAGYKAGTAEWMGPSRAVLQTPTTPAGVLVIAARNVLGPGMAAYEPDTLRIELEREKLSVPEVNFNKLLAALTLLEAPAFYFDANVFSQTTLSFNHELPDTEVLYEASPAQMCWSVYEAELLLHDHQLFEPEFDYEVSLYVAGALWRAGFVLAPAILSWSQADLDNFNKGKAGLKVEEVREAWAKLPKNSLTTQVFAEDPLGVHLAKLAACQVYLSEEAEKYAKALNGLRL